MDDENVTGRWVLRDEGPGPEWAGLHLGIEVDLRGRSMG